MTLFAICKPHQFLYTPQTEVTSRYGIVVFVVVAMLHILICALPPPTKEVFSCQMKFEPYFVF